MTTEIASPPPTEIARKYSIRRPDEILAMTFDDSDQIIGDHLIAKGLNCVMVGPPGIGKSRLALQFAVGCRAGFPVIGWKAHAPEATWLFIQTENSRRRQKFDLQHLADWVGPDRWPHVNAGIWLHTLETDFDGLMSLEALETRKQLKEIVGDLKPSVVVWDCLQSFAVGDLNHDQDMFATAMTIADITKQGHPDRTPLVLHHAHPGRVGAAKALGFEKGAYSRNSKALLGWARTTINLAAGNEEGTSVVVGCGKQSDGEEFDAFALVLNKATMIYEVDQDFNLTTWRADMTRTAPLAITDAAVGELATTAGCNRKALKDRIMAAVNCPQSVAYKAINRALRAKTLVHLEDLNLFVQSLS